ncbi:MAG: flippase [Chloroflexi bacterium]|nr:flippase [Chloroflexota bacterium]
MKDARTVVANVIVLFVKQLATWSFTGVLILYLPRYLGDEGLGQITFADSFSGMFIWLLLLGVPTYLVKEVARDRERISSYLFNSLVMRMPLAAVVFLIVFLSVNVLGYSSQTKTVVYIGALITIVQSLNHVAGAVLQGIENMRWQAVADVVGKAVVSGAGIFVLINGHGVVAYASVLLLGTIVSLAINLSFFLVRIKVRPELDLRVWRILLVGGFPFLLTSVISTVYLNVDVTMLRLMTSEAVVGWYGAASQLFNTLNFASLLLSVALLPALSRLHKSAPSRMISASKRGFHFCIVLSLPMSVGTVLISDKIISALKYPEVFANSVPLLAILSASLPISSTLVVLGTMMAAADKQQQWAKTTAAGVVLNIVLNLLLIPVTHNLYGNGGIGAALASFVAETAIMIVGARVLPWNVFDRSLLEVFVKSLAGAGLMGLAVWSVHSIDVLVIIFVGALFYGAFSLLVRSIGVEDLALVRDVIMRRQLAVGN